MKKPKPMKFDLIAIPLPKGQLNTSGVFYEDLERKAKRRCKCRRAK